MNFCKRHPISYFGPPGLGINAGVALLNLTRWQIHHGDSCWKCYKLIPVENVSFKIKRYVGRWIHRDGALPVGKTQVTFASKSLCWTLHISSKSLSLADQDLLNILGSQSPWLIQPLPCEWHYHTWSCSTEIYESRFISRMKYRMNQCPNAAKRGISLLHGNCQAFTTVPSKNGKKPINPRQPCQGDAVLRTVFTFWADQVPVLVLFLLEEKFIAELINWVIFMLVRNW